jgi:hypothetical protein
MDRDHLSHMGLASRPSTHTDHAQAHLMPTFSVNVTDERCAFNARWVSSHTSEQKDNVTGRVKICIKIGPNWWLSSRVYKGRFSNSDRPVNLGLTGGAFTRKATISSTKGTIRLSCYAIVPRREGGYGTDSGGTRIASEPVSPSVLFLRRPCHLSPLDGAGPDHPRMLEGPRHSVV